MFTEPETWVAIAFVILMGLFAYLGIHRTVLKALDHRAERIKAELDDARRLKDEAAALLAEYKTKRASAEREAAEIISNARAEAERIAAEAKTKMEDFVARRTKTAEGKIALAEAQALADVRAAAANAAVAAASTDPVAVGERLRGRRPPGQGHCRGSRQAELKRFNHRDQKPARPSRAGFFIASSSAHAARAAPASGPAGRSRYRKRSCRRLRLTVPDRPGLPPPA
jgi:F0F1-type ATP synthase, subunit b